MLDINLGNKTLTVGVAIALILAYGMINFDSGNNAEPVFQTVAAGTHETPTPAPTATPSGEDALPTDIDVEALSAVQQASVVPVPERDFPMKWKLED